MTQNIERMKPLIVFISYSHKDEEYRTRLEVHLAMLKRQCVIELWHDRCIEAGQELHDKIDSHLATDDIILLLISPDFLASNYCYEKEMTRAIQRHQLGTARVIPVILRPCDWQHPPIDRLMAVPADGRPISRFTDPDEPFLEVTRAIRDVAEKFSLNRETVAPVSQTPQAPELPVYPIITPAAPAPIRLKKVFSDLEKDRFIEESFETIARYFESGLNSLKASNPGVDTNFRRIDANHFSAKVYVGGKEKSCCKIWIGGQRSFPGGILYSYSPGMEDSSFNESLTIVDDGFSMFLHPLGTGFGVTARKAQMTVSEATEYYWHMFVDSLQY